MLFQDSSGEFGGDLFAGVLEDDAMLHPLMQLATADLCGRSVFHETVDGHAAGASQPCFHVLQTDVQVLHDTVCGDLTVLDLGVDKVLGRDLIFGDEVDLVSGAHVGKDLVTDGGKGGMCDPGAVVAVGQFADLIVAHLGHGLFVRDRVVFDWDLGGHTPHGVNATAVACVDESLDVGVHEWRGHCHLVSVRQDVFWQVSQPLDRGENVIPATTVQPTGVVSELVDDLFHLEGCGQSLDQDGCPDGATGNCQVVLRDVENVVPQFCFKVVLHLWEVKVRPLAYFD